MPDSPITDEFSAELGKKLLSINPEAWLAAIVDSSDDAIIGKTLDTIIRSWNSGATRIFGYEAHEIVGKSVYTLIPPERHDEEPAIIGRLSRGERVDHFETVRVRKDGSHVEVSLSVSPIRDKKGRIIGAAKIARDITDAKRLQRAERELTEQLQELASELEQQVEEAQTLQEELEQTNEELMRSLTDAEESREEALAAREQAVESRHEAERARTEAQKANAAKSEFLAMMSHELRTPLNAIAGYVDLLEMEIRGSLNPEQRQDLVRIKKSQRTLLRLIEDVLNFAKLESGRLEFRYEPVDMNEFLATLEQFVAPRLTQKHLGYRLDRCRSDAVIPIDRDKVEQIMLNLLSNAVKFTDSGEIVVRCEVDRSRVRIHVCDTGRGIRADLRESIFEPFVQGDPSLTRTAEGTGLGLSISRQLARAMGGDITIESEVGHGSVFTLSLPRRHADG
jgi:PAS domain S-box-containing protein